MKKQFFPLVMIILTMLPVKAQETSFGVKGGLNMAKISNIDDGSISSTSVSSSKIKYKFGPQLGVYATIELTDMIAFQPELLLSFKGYLYEANVNALGIVIEVNSRASINYIEVPLQLRINPHESIGITGGPYLAILTGAKSVTTTKTGNSTTEEKRTITDDIKDIDIGFNIGCLYQLDNGLNFGIKYGIGFIDVFEDSGNTDDETNANSVFQLFTGYTFKLR